jgi:hypothetical protein
VVKTSQIHKICRRSHDAAHLVELLLRQRCVVSTRLQQVRGGVKRRGWSEIGLRSMQQKHPSPAATAIQADLPKYGEARRKACSGSECRSEHKFDCGDILVLASFDTHRC